MLPATNKQITIASNLTVFYAVLHRDLLLSGRQISAIFQPVLFFIIITSLFPLGISPNSRILHTLAPGIIWIAALLANVLALEYLFKQDFIDGSLEQLVLSQQSLSILIGAKCLAHFLVSGLPIILFSPLLGLLLHMRTEEVSVLVISLLLGTPVLTLVGAIITALTQGLRTGGGLLALLLLPLYIPILIFGAGSVGLVSSGLPATGLLSILAALLALSITLAPLAIAAAVRVSLAL